MNEKKSRISTWICKENASLEICKNIYDDEWFIVQVTH